VITPDSNLCQWSNGIIGGLNQVVSPGSYFVVCENLDGCSGTSDTVIVEMVNNPEAAFTYSQIDNYTVDFYNNSTNATSYQWQFPNGISFDANTSYDFVSNGIYQIQLIASNECGSDSVLVDIVVDKLSTVNEYGNLQTKIFPNPANEKITIILNKPANNISIEVYDMYGKLLIAEANKSGKQFDLNTSAFASGAYCIKLSIADTQSRTMFIKN
jgi:PKD repeat protein